MWNIFVIRKNKARKKEWKKERKKKERERKKERKRESKKEEIATDVCKTMANGCPAYAQNVSAADAFMRPAFGLI